MFTFIIESNAKLMSFHRMSGKGLSSVSEKMVRGVESTYKDGCFIAPTSENSINRFHRHYSRHHRNPTGLSSKFVILRMKKYGDIFYLH